jgi:hypothetical protein
VGPQAGGELGVDVVIANHDYGRFLAEAIESALAQTHPKLEVVVVDDGSGDESREVLRDFEDRVEVVLKEQGGQASALNAGFERGRGEVLLVLDADDRLRPQAAERVAAAFAADPSLVKVQFPMVVVDANGQPTGAVKPPGHLRAPVGDVRRAELRFPFDLPWLPGGGTAFRRRALERIMPIPESDYPRYGADWYLVHLTALLGTAGLLDSACAEYRVHGANAYEQDRPDLDLDHIRDSIRFARVTTASLERLANELALERPRPLLSTADLANRLISLRLEPQAHPLPDDRRGRLLVDALRSLRRRFDVGVAMKLLFALWFALEAVLPRGLAAASARFFLFPERRPALNRLLACLHADDRD